MNGVDVVTLEHLNVTCMQVFHKLLPQDESKSSTDVSKELKSFTLDLNNKLFVTWQK